MQDQPVAIVTAAGQGIGAGIARELHARGWRLALMSPSGRSEALAKDLGAIGLRGSVTAPSDLEQLVRATQEAYGRIDGVVNNTGPIIKGDLLEIADDAWHASLDLVILNVVRMTRLVTPVMVAQGGGAFVNISTYSAFEPEGLFPVSSTLRAGLGSFAKLYADRYGPQGIRMNNVLPGMVDNLPVKESNIPRIPLRRYARVSEIAATVAFLLSDDAGYITGQNIRIDGGLSRSV
jgi:NAD(P)-dependent dehydrogenase (short-subunit alcohol dehydrogenase family)